MSQRPLDGIKVLSFEIQVAGPYCSMMLADQGAYVIKVERPGEGDTARGGAPMLSNDAGEKSSGYFMRFNRNKRSLTLDLKGEEGREIFRRLASEVDVVIENFRPGVLDGMGLGYDELSKLNPGLVYATISGFGAVSQTDGPYSSRPAYDIIAQAMSGLMHTCGQDGGPPTWLGVALGDIVSGMNAAYGIMLALYERQHTGRGRFVDISMYDSMVALAERSVSAYSLTGRVLERGHEPFMAPWGPFQTADGWVALLVVTQREWVKFCEAIGRPDLADTEGTRSGPERASNMSGWLGNVIREWMRARPTGEVMEKLLAAGLPIGPVQTSEDVFSCPQIALRDLFVDVPVPVAGTARLVGSPVRLVGAPPARAEAVPTLGQHSDEILAELGFDEGERERLRAAGVV